MTNYVKGIIFDYGGTIDTNSVHWSEVLWEGYRSAGIDIDKSHFRDAYVHGERTLARQPLILPGHTMLDLLRIKVDIETKFLVGQGLWLADETQRADRSEVVADYCYAHVLDVLSVSREVLRCLASHFPLVLVSNFYGNLQAILKDFRLEYFQAVVESAVVGIRKPDSRIFQLGVDALGMAPQEVLVVGDSFSKDIVPATAIGCQTAWIRGKGWAEEEVDEQVPTAIFTSLTQLPGWFQLSVKNEL